MLVVVVPAFAEDGDGSLHRPPGAREAALVNRKLGAASIDRVPQPGDGEVGELLGYPFEAAADLVELTGH